MSNPSGLCKCGCGETTSLIRHTITKLGLVKGEPRDYIHGHQRRGKTADLSGIVVNESGLCLCGCGAATQLAPTTNRSRGWIAGKPMNYIRGHSPWTGDIAGVKINESGLCKCGCGRKTPLAKNTIVSKGLIKGQPVNWIQGHNRRPHEKTLSYPELNFDGFCLCGCGQRTKIATYSMVSLGIEKGVPLRHVYGHQSKDSNLLGRYEVKDMGYETSCWMWTGPTDIQGYGKTGGTGVVAHRKVYEKTHGKLAKGMLLHHLCENKGCVNPDHLQPLTRADHMRAHAKRIPNETIRAIEEDLRAANGSDATIAARYGVSPSFVWNTRHGKR